MLWCILHYTHISLSLQDYGNQKQMNIQLKEEVAHLRHAMAMLTEAVRKHDENCPIS